jgi:hypothetical protein
MEPFRLLHLKTSLMPSWSYKQKNALTGIFCFEFELGQVGFVGLGRLVANRFA